MLTSSITLSCYIKGTGGDIFYYKPITGKTIALIYTLAY